MNNIIISPEYELLRNEIEILKEELVKVLSSFDHLKYTICPNIQMEYMLLLGDLEYRLLNAEYSYRKIKRKIELIRAKLNRNENIDINKIDELLDKELEEFLLELNNKMHMMNEALKRNQGTILNSKDSSELKSLYRKIVKKLHPDINPFINHEQLNLYYNAVNAYKDCDIKALKLIFNLIKDMNINDNYDSINELRLSKESLKESIDKVKKDIDIIKNKFPYNIRSLLNNKEELRNKRNEYEKQLNDYLNAIKKGEEILNELLDDMEDYIWQA